MLPVELLSLGASTGISFVMKLIGSWMENKAEERKLLLTQQRMEVEQHALLVKQSGGFAITRRIIALSAVACLLVWPSFSGLLHLPVHFPVETGGSTSVLWGLFATKTAESHYTAKMGIVFFEWHKHVLLAIIGFYFGQTFARRS